LKLMSMYLQKVKSRFYFYFLNLFLLAFCMSVTKI
jgi:hypothetical protein